MQAGAAVPVGATKTFAIQLYVGNWWIQYDGQWIGYFPDSLWGGRFTRTGLNQWFGEVAASSGAPCTDMGNGLYPGNPSADQFTGMGLINGPGVQLGTLITNGAYYNGQASGNSFRFGGLGAC